LSLAAHVVRATLRGSLRAWRQKYSRRALRGI
jgi:hypothetical protein